MLTSWRRNWIMSMSRSKNNQNRFIIDIIDLNLIFHSPRSGFFPWKAHLFHVMRFRTFWSTFLSRLQILLTVILFLWLKPEFRAHCGGLIHFHRKFAWNRHSIYQRWHFDCRCFFFSPYPKAFQLSICDLPVVNIFNSFSSTQAVVFQVLLSAYRFISQSCYFLLQDGSFCHSIDRIGALSFEFFKGECIFLIVFQDSGFLITAFLLKVLSYQTLISWSDHPFFSTTYLYFRLASCIRP